MTSTELAWHNYQQAERRVDACKAANDRTGLLIAQSSATHWHEIWQVADQLAVNAVSGRSAGSTARSAASAS